MWGSVFGIHLGIFLDANWISIPILQVLQIWIMMSLYSFGFLNVFKGFTFKHFSWKLCPSFMLDLSQSFCGVGGASASRLSSGIFSAVSCPWVVVLLLRGSEVRSSLCHRLGDATAPILCSQAILRTLMPPCNPWSFFPLSWVSLDCLLPKITS